MYCTVSMRKCVASNRHYFLGFTFRFTSRYCNYLLIVFMSYELMIYCTVMWFSFSWRLFTFVIVELNQNWMTQQEWHLPDKLNKTSSSGLAEYGTFESKYLWPSWAGISETQAYRSAPRRPVRSPQSSTAEMWLSVWNTIPHAVAEECSGLVVSSNASASLVGLNCTAVHTNRAICKLQTTHNFIQYKIKALQATIIQFNRSEGLQSARDESLLYRIFDMERECPCRANW